MAENIPVEFTVAVTPLPPVVLSEVQERVRVKLAMAGLDAELTLEEFAAYRGVSFEQARRNLRRTRGVCRSSKKGVGIHLRTYLDQAAPGLTPAWPRRRKLGPKLGPA